MNVFNALPANGTVRAQDLTVFLDQSIGGGAVTAFDISGSPVNIQLRWAKVDSADYGGTDTWNLFYQVELQCDRRAIRLAERRRELHVRRQRPDESGHRQPDADRRDRERRRARRRPARPWLRRHHPVRRRQRQRAGQHPAAERLPGRRIAAGLGQRQGPRRRQLFERPHASISRRSRSPTSTAPTTSSASTAAPSR